MCKESYYHAPAQLHIETWCGDLDDPVKQVCELDDQTKARHRVYVRSIKTVDRKITIRGRLERNSAKFESEGGAVTVKSETEWVCERTLYRDGGLREVLVGDALVTKKAHGDEVVKVEVECENAWNKTVVERADSNKLVFRIHVT